MDYEKGNQMPSVGTGIPKQEPELQRILCWMQKNNSVTNEMLSRLENICNTLHHIPEKTEANPAPLDKEPSSVVEHYNSALMTQAALINRLEKVVSKLTQIVGN